MSIAHTARKLPISWGQTVQPEAIRAIMRQTGHRSVEVLRRYIRAGTLWDENAAAFVGL